MLPFSILDPCFALQRRPKHFTGSQEMSSSCLEQPYAVPAFLGTQIKPVTSTAVVLRAFHPNHPFNSVPLETEVPLVSFYYRPYSSKSHISGLNIQMLETS